MFPRLILATLLTAGAFTALRAQPAASPIPAVPVILKLDDVRTNDSGKISERWRRVGELARQRNLKIALGVICDSLEGNKPAYFSWLKELQASGLVELWFHGYDHAVWKGADGKALSEFGGRSFEDQLDRFARSQKLAQEKLGLTFSTFGPGGGGSLHQDAATARAMAEEPGMKVWLYPSPLDDQGRQLAAAGKVTILDRVWQVNLEQPLFVPNYQKFVEGYSKYAAKRRYFVLQGHPNKWDDARWAEFLKIVDFITENKIPTVTPTELAASLKASGQGQP
ncbi:MAG TPA: DUF2334 domain-containing protein [Opitutaceae bacterium]